MYENSAICEISEIFKICKTFAKIYEADYVDSVS